MLHGGPSGQQDGSNTAWITLIPASSLGASGVSRLQDAVGSEYHETVSMASGMDST